MSVTRIPRYVALPFLEEYLSNYETHGWDGQPGQGYLPEMSSSKILALQAGVKPDTLNRFLTGIRETIDFYSLDRLFSAMDQTLLWYEWPLLVFYLAADLEVPPPGYKRCARPGCFVEFKVTEKPSNQGRHKFCSHECATGDSHGHAHRESFCRNMHPRTPENTRIMSKGERCCRICIRESDARRRQVAA